MRRRASPTATAPGGARLGERSYRGRSRELARVAAGGFGPLPARLTVLHNRAAWFDDARSPMICTIRGLARVREVIWTG
jgi:hypothetical protein